MQITRQADYALRAILYLARLGPDQKASTKQIAAAQEIPPSFLAKIISELKKGKLVTADRGAGGGVSLARKPEEISLLDVVEAIDDTISLNECTADPSICSFGDSCPLHEVWCEAEAQLIRKLREATFDKLLEREKAKAEKINS
jgi:Rrf2 family protein